MARLRVLHLITQLELGGAQQNTLFTVSHLDPSVFQTFLITGPGGILDAEAKALPGVEVRFCSSLKRSIDPLADTRAFFSLRKHIREVKPDIVHTHSSKAGILGRMAAWAEDVPVIIHTYHGFGFHRFQQKIVFHAYLLAERQACKKSHHLIFVSGDNREWAGRLGLLQKCSFSIIRSGVEVKNFPFRQKDNSFRNRLSIPSGSTLIGMIACLKTQKDPLTFVEAADRVTQKIPNCWFVLIGEGILKGKVDQQVTSMRSPDRFIQLGWQRNIPEILRSLDVVVLTSLWEGLPRTLVEATLSGVPIVASNIDGNREIVEDGKNGFLAEPQNADDFAQKIIRVLESEFVPEEDYARKIRAEFDIHKMVKEQEQLYLQLAAASKRPLALA